MRIVLKIQNIIRLFVLLQAGIFLPSLEASAETTVNLVRYVCTDATSSSFIFDGIKAPQSDGYCGKNRTDIEIDLSGQTDMGTVTRNRIDDGPFRAQINIDWNPGTTGVLLIKVSYTLQLYEGWPKFNCKRTGRRYMYTYVIHREDISPGGGFTGTTTSFVPNDQTESIFNLYYSPNTAAFESSGYRATRIKYFNGKYDENHVPIIKDQPIAEPVTYYATGKNSYVIQTEVLMVFSDANGAGCEKWIAAPIPPVTVEVRSSCFLDDFSKVSIYPTGAEADDVNPYDHPLAYGLKKGKTYTLNISGLTDEQTANFLDNYKWNFGDFGPIDMHVTGYSFTLPEDLAQGSYRITVNANVDDCPVPDAIPILIDIENKKLIQKCTATLPADIGDWYRSYSPNDPILRHFAGFVQTDRSIILEPGVTLELGAELFLDYPDPAPDPEDADKKMNYTEQTSFDEYGKVLGASRSYFDKRGMALQTQVKNLSAGAILANAILNDAYGRPAISTLAAPVAISTVKIDPDNCPDDPQVGSTIRFAYSPAFVKASDGIYAARHFDIDRDGNSNEMSPAPVDATEENTLGWYYSANNTKEPLVAATKYPYSRKLYKHDGSGAVLGVTKPGDAFRAGSLLLAQSDQQPVLPDDPYFNLNDNKSYLSIRKHELGFDVPASIDGEFFKTVSTDESGKKSVTYTDKSGKIIITLYFGDQITPITQSYQFYDKAGRLLVSISPNGIDQYNYECNSTVCVSNFEIIDKTKYFYNNKGLLKAVEEKIAGREETSNGISRAEYVYRKDRRIRFSQNQEQRNASPKRYSYTNYDNAGRPIESGEYTMTNDASISFNSAEMLSILENTDVDGGLSETNGIKNERTYTLYDEPDTEIPISSTAVPKRTQRFVYGAVSRSKKVNYNPNSGKMEDQITTWYSYDERGRVEWVVQYIVGLGVKTLDYRYGPTGQVQDVTYQKGIVNTEIPSKTEQFVHFYEYDADGRLKKVYTGSEYLVYDKFGKITNEGVSYIDATGEIDNPGTFELQATYKYYLHGPLKRIELAKDVQGIDYVYTADGALKGINNADPEPNNADPGTYKDPGKDGKGNGFSGFAKDVFGMSLDYYAKDYASAKGNADQVVIPGNADQYTGLIKAMRWHSPTEKDKQFAYAYDYDQRNQFKQANWGEVEGPQFTSSELNYHEEVIKYDAGGHPTDGGYDLNGNITKLKRFANDGVPLANFSYNYKTYTNILQSISQDDQTFRDYAYNDLGQMIKEVEGDESKFVMYDVTGKVTAVYTDQEHTKPITTFTYDDRGFRLNKTSYNKDFKPVLCTWYVRDASGNLVSTYEQPFDLSTQVAEVPKMVEVPVYGSSRIGMYEPQTGFTLYELSDHLGNVRAVIGPAFDNEYLATMEDERADQEENEDGFIIKRSGPAIYNHTPSDIVENKQIHLKEPPGKVSMINNRPVPDGGTTGESHPDPIGTSIMLPVQPGDVISTDVFVKYTAYEPPKIDPLAGLVGFITTTFHSPAAVDAAVSSFVNSSNYTSLFTAPKFNDAQPRIFLNYLLFDNNSKLLKFDFVQAKSDQVPADNPDLHEHESLMIDNITIEKEGFIYIYVSNESNQNLTAYFDDLRVQQKHSNIVAGGDFYPYGLAIKDRQINRDLYRYGYQGKFAEKDEETEWNHFEFREYDPAIGRWLSIDPKRQFSSPYVGMGNNPINRQDPDGKEIFPINEVLQKYGYQTREVQLFPELSTFRKTILTAAKLFEVVIGEWIELPFQAGQTANDIADNVHQKIESAGWDNLMNYQRNLYDVKSKINGEIETFGTRIQQLRERESSFNNEEIKSLTKAKWLLEDQLIPVDREIRIVQKTLSDTVKEAEF